MSCQKGKVLNIKIEQGATFNPQINLKTNLGNPVDLTGCTITSKMRRTFDAATAYAFTCTILSPATDGSFTWEMSAATTASIDVSGGTSFVYDVEVLFPDTTVQRIMQGTVSVSPEATK
jgi:hypothetical protein